MVSSLGPGLCMATRRGCEFSKTTARSSRFPCIFKAKWNPSAKPFSAGVATDSEPLSLGTNVSSFCEVALALDTAGDKYTQAQVHRRRTRRM